MALSALGCSPAGTASDKTGEVPSRRDFRIGVFLAADRHPQNLQLSRMVADWAGHGINTVCMREDIYANLAPQGLNTLAKQWGVDLVVSPIFGAGPTHRARMRELIRLVNGYPDSDAVKAWYACDEFEGRFGTGRPPGVEETWREVVSAIKSLDPTREVIVNHDSRIDSWGGRFAYLGENESWCSTFWANRYASDFLKKTLNTHRRAYGNDCPALTFVYGAQSNNKAGDVKSLEPHGITGVTLEQLRSVSTRDDIADYILTAHGLGAGGAVFFCYDGYYDFQHYTLVDERGRSVEGKMEGIRFAAEQIAGLAGRPKLTMAVQDKTAESNQLRIEVTTVPGSRPVERVAVEISYNGGYTWHAVPGFGPHGGTVEHGYVPEGRWSMLRARCDDGKCHSLWSVWNVFPISPPRLHE